MENIVEIISHIKERDSDRERKQEKERKRESNIEKIDRYVL